MSEMRNISSFASNKQTIVNTEYLDVTALEEGEFYTKIAYVTSASTGMTKMETGFVKFILKDCKGRVIVARLFNVKDFIFSGIKTTMFQNKMVRLSFVPQVFNGTLSLVIDGIKGISVYESDVDISLFIGKVTTDNSVLHSFAKSLLGEEWSLTISEYESSSIETVGYGRVGAFAALLNSMIMSISGMSWLSSDEIKEIIVSALIASDIYFRCDKKLSKLDNYLSLAERYKLKFENKAELMPVVIEVAGAMLQLTEPRLFYSHVIYNTFKNAITSMNVAFALETVPVGSETCINGLCIINV